jgi:EAL domain-containing protein (putative c-di-GMP-specific phosphodiesterase class I)
MLKSFGVDAVQGYYMERPHPECRPGVLLTETLVGANGHN